jgi:hypothetical protein
MDALKKRAFMRDFMGNNTKLASFNSESHLIDSWDEIQNLKVYRVDLKFLRSYYNIKNNLDLQDHVHLGDFSIKMRGGNATIGEAKIVGSHNLVALRNPPPPPLLSGEMSWKIPPPVEYSNPSDILNSYSQGKVQRDMSDLIDPMTGTNYVNGDGISIATKKKLNVYFPKNYSTQRINEEMSYALSQIDIKLPNKKEVNSLGQYSFTYFSKATDGHVLEIVYLSNNSNPLNGTLQTIYPQNF